MANLTKEQRLAKEAEKEAKLKAELEAQLRAELEEKIKAELEEKLRVELEEKLNVPTNDNKTTAKTIQNSAKIPLDTIVPVVCNVVGGATYVSTRTIGYTVVWDAYESVEYVELAELVAMRNTARRFYEDNWIVLEDTDEYSAIQLYEFLKVTKYYEKVFTPENIDTIFEMEESELIRTISSLSRGMKETIAARAKIKYDAKELDSNKKIEALETALKVKFSI